MVEIWKYIKGYGNKYKISNLGNIVNVKPYKSEEPKPVKRTLVKNENVYIVHLKWNGVQYGKRVARLVAEAFIPNPECKSNVLFKNGMTTDCRAENLYWANHKENPNYDKAVKNSVNSRSVRIIQLTMSGEPIREYASAAEAARQNKGFQANSISRVCNGIAYSYKGYLWSHKIS